MTSRRAAVEALSKYFSNFSSYRDPYGTLFQAGGDTDVTQFIRAHGDRKATGSSKTGNPTVTYFRTTTDRKTVEYVVCPMHKQNNKNSRYLTGLINVDLPKLKLSPNDLQAMLKADITNNIKETYGEDIPFKAEKPKDPKAQK